jgi:hypothetical protein
MFFPYNNYKLRKTCARFRDLTGKRRKARIIQTRPRTGPESKEALWRDTIAMLRRIANR